jgi:hypothetical protein
MEAILKTYFGVENVDLSERGLEMLGELAPQSKTKIPLLKAETKTKKRA